MGDHGIPMNQAVESDGVRQFFMAQVASYDPEKAWIYTL
jgi:hypothetical protein